MESILKVDNLSKVFLRGGQQPVTAVKNVSFELMPGECLGVLGESGSGQDQAVYMDMEAASLPSITVQMLGRDMNRLYGYRQEMNTTAAGENLTILPEDRALTVDKVGS